MPRTFARGVALSVALLLASGCGGASGSSAERPGATFTPLPISTPGKATHPAGKHGATHGPVKIRRKHPRQVPGPARIRPVTRPAVRSGVHPGSFCSPAGALGRTKTGTLMKCVSRGGGHARWRSG
ncbi:hypothetical protein [Nonomuraea sp. NPDC046570]|uniref:hypothetical protein n=1 Tax=Nonomuraea sp. NPDC046570 TaxID=3155255 RepID=UPI0033E4BC1D